jgi:hypothetical protein
VLAEAGLALGEVDAVAATAGPGLIGGVMVGLVTAKGLALAAGKPLIAVNHLEGHALSPRLAIPTSISPICCCSSRAAIASCCSSKASAATAASPPRSTMPPARRSTRARSCSASAFPGGPAVERAAADGRCEGGAPAAPAARLAEPHFSFAGLKSAVLRARESGRLRRADIAASFQQAVVDCLIDRTRRAMEEGGGRDRTWSSPAASPPTGDPRRARRSRRRATRPALRRAAFLAVHRQCRDDRLGRRGALRGGAGRRPRRAGAGPLAARSRRREGARRRGEGMKLGVIGGGAWGTALAQVAAAGGRGRPALGARARGGRGDQPRSHREHDLPQRREARPSRSARPAISAISERAKLS